jgi:hypothetical protein
MKKISFVIAALLFIALAAPAQMHRNQPQPSPGTGMPGMGDSMGPMHFAVTSDGTAVVVDRETAHTSGTLPVDTLVGYNAAGVKAWTLDVGGVAMGVQAAANQIYLLVVTQDARKLVAVSSAGKIVWSVTLD